MTYLPHLKLVANGGMPGGERWSCGLTAHLTDIAVPQGALNNLAAGLLTAWGVLVEDTNVVFSNGTTLTRVDVRQVDPQGVTVKLAQASPSNNIEGNVGAAMPNQVAVVASLRTGTPGARGRGRVYLPLLGAQVGTNGRLVGLQRGNIANGMKTLLDSINDDLVSELGTGNWLSVESGVGSGLSSRMTSVRVGDVLDTQRRRRDKIQEAYVELPVDDVTS